MILNEQETQEKIVKAVNTVANVVKTTLGPNGHNILLEELREVHTKDGRLASYPVPKFTKDGVSVAKQVTSRDPVEMLVMDAVKQAAVQTHTDAGDGTTSSIILTQAIINNAIPGITGRNIHKVKEGINLAVEQVVKTLKEKAKHIKVGDPLLKKVALVASNGDENVASLIEEAFNKVGEGGSTWIEESKSDNSYVELIDGCFYNQGFLHPQFVNNPKKESCELENVKILLWGGKIKNYVDLQWVWDYFTFKATDGKWYRKNETINESLLIICDEAEGEALNTLVAQASQGILRNCVIKAYGMGPLKADVMNDLAAITGGKYIDDVANMELKKASPKDFGNADKVIITRLGTTFIGGKADEGKVAERREHIKALMETNLDEFAAAEVRLRDKRLAGGLATIYVGGKTEPEMKERLDRVDDALRAVKSALEEGVVAGGGSVFYGLSTTKVPIQFTPQNAVRVYHETMGVGDTYSMTDIEFGNDVVFSSLSSVAKQLHENSYMNIDLSAKLEVNQCHNSDGEIVDAFEAGIVDPVKVLRVSLQNAASVSVVLILTKHISTRV